jgi:putative membrane protein
MNDDNQDKSTPQMRGLSQTRPRRGMMGWVIGGLVILLLAGLFVAPFLSGFPAAPYGYYPFPFFFPFGFFIFFFLIFFVVRGLFWGWGWGWRGGYSRGYWHNWGYYGDATEILKQRYARGEITKDQFDQMMRDLQAHDA